MMIEKSDLLIMLAVQILLVALLVWTSSEDYKDEQQTSLQYCEQVQIWLDDEARGVPLEHRKGWPPFRGECDK